MTRHRLPNRRPTERFRFEHAGAVGYVTVGFPVEITAENIYLAAEPGEVFIQYGKAGSDVEAAARDGGLLLSIAMQHGIDLRVFALSLTRLDDGTAASVIGAAVDEIVRNFQPPEPPVPPPEPEPQPLAERSAA